MERDGQGKIEIAAAWDGYVPGCRCFVELVYSVI